MKGEGRGEAPGRDELAILRLRRAFVASVLVIAGLVLVGQWLVQQSLAAYETSATVVNLAGRQRMLSQRLTKVALLASRATSRESYERLQAMLTSDLAEWQAAHARLHGGEYARVGLAVVTPRSQRLIAEADAPLQQSAPGSALLMKPIAQGQLVAAIDRLVADAGSTERSA
ncbi:MAG: type IV pili methyl-accepting chemotaxis transducer N-terminal domain-containing protein [Myxococcales bacterium]|nr:type IV pili methyl-accepting chemotaxis transducer N-terminal domain-containing protein [Myxococcales bacterium]